MILKRELKPLRQRIHAMWMDRMDTMDMAKVMQVPEQIVERELHAVLELRRSVAKIQADQ